MFNQDFKKLMEQMQIELDTFDQHLRLNKSIDLAKLRLNELNQMKLNLLNINKFHDHVHVIKGLKVLLQKIISLNDELNDKDKLARIINQNIIELPVLFDEIIQKFQDGELINKLSENLVKINEEIIEFQMNITDNKHNYEKFSDDQQEQQILKTQLNEQFEELNSKANEFKNDLRMCRQINDRLSEEKAKIEDEHNQIESNLIQLKNNFDSIHQMNEMMKMKLNEKYVLFNKLRDKKQALINGTFVDEETEKIQIKLEHLKDEHKKKCEQIEIIKLNYQSNLSRQQSIKMPRLQNEMNFNLLKALLMKLVELISLNYKDKYLVFDN